MDQERRQGPRFSFIATAEVMEEKSEARIATRVSELSLRGCYLDMMNPFPSNTLVLVKIWEGANYFEGHGKMAYVQEHLGAGVSFLKIEDKYLQILQNWLKELERKTNL